MSGPQQQVPYTELEDWGKLLQRNDRIPPFEENKERILVLKMPAQIREVDIKGQKVMEMAIACVEDCGEPTDKPLISTSKPLFKALAPVANLAKVQGKTTFKVSITRIGASTSTQYFVKLVE